MGFSRRKFIILLFILSAMLVGFAPPADEPPLQITETLPGQQIILRAEERVIPFHVPPPEQAELGIQSATFNVNWNPPNCNGSTTDWPTNAKTAFNYALGIWGALINSSVPIEVDACWRSDLGSGVLGSAGATTIHGNFSGAPETYTWYPVALANAIRGNDTLNNDTAEIEANFSSTFDWYYGTDGNAAWDEYDFVSVVLHEVGHGLGFLGSAYVSGSLGYWGDSSYQYPIIYDRFAEDNGGTPIINYTSGSTALASVLTSDNVFFDGPNANAANGGQRVELYAPTNWNPGSSYSHLGQIFDGTENALMTYSLGWGESEHSPGPVTLGIFEDLGWSVNIKPDLQISQTVIGSNLEPGDAVSFELSIENVGDAAATGVVVTDTLPAEILLPGWSTTFPGGTVSVQSGTTYVWDLPNLDPGDSGTITVSGTIDPTLPDDFGLTNSVSISAAEAESNTANNSSTAGVGTFHSYLPIITRNYADTETLSIIELELLNLINTERTGRGLAQLSNSSLLNQVAAAHSADMRDRDFFDHTNPDGDDPGDRLTNAGYNWSTYGETIGAGYTSAQAMFDGWMDSDGHRAILLGSSYTEIGLGYETGGSWGHYWTAVTATPR